MINQEQTEDWVLNTEAQVSLDLATPLRGQEIVYRKYRSDQVPFLSTLRALLKSGLFQSLEQILDAESLADCSQIPAAHLDYLKQMNILVKASELGRRPHYQVNLESQLLPMPLAATPHDLLWNPDLFVQWGREWPPEFQPAPAFLEQISAQRPIIWCRSLTSGCWFPYWVSADLAVLIDQQQADRISRLAPDLLQNLSAAEILAAPTELEREIPYADFQRRLQQQGYLHLSGLLPPLHRLALQQHLATLRQEGFFQQGDPQVKARDTVHNEPVLRFFQAQICSQLLQSLGLAIQPSYNYLAYYHPGAVMPYHTDREQCEWNMSVLIDQPTEGPGSDWPLCLQTPTGPQPMSLAVGDGLLYQGSQMPHWRETLRGEQGVGVGLLHYVSLDYQGSL